MPSLIIISCFLGIGCGIVIPLAAGMLAQYFTGKYRMKQLGIKSGIANFCLIFATFVVGWLGQKNWHLPFIVYLVPIIPIILTKFFSKKYIDKEEIVAEEERDKNKIIEPNYNLEISKKIQTRRIIGLMLFYFIIK